MFFVLCFILTVSLSVRVSAFTGSVAVSKKSVSLKMNVFDNFVKGFSSTTASKPTSGNLQSVAITGATGLVGTELCKRLAADDVKVVKLTTRSNLAMNGDNQEIVTWDPSSGALDNAEALEGVDAIIHLAGENVATGDFSSPFTALGAWSEGKKSKIFESRQLGTKLLVDTIKQMKKKPKVLISASGSGVYGYSDSTTVFDESNKKATSGDGFLAAVCRVWEEEALKAQSLGVRTVCVRFPPIFSTKAGILAKLLPIFGLGAGGNLGAGDQAFSWVSLEDAIRAIEFALDNKKISGPVNVCSPNPVTNAEFTSAMGAALNRPAVIPVPEIAVNLIFGEMGQEMLLGGQKCTPKKLSQAGFQFEDENIEEAIRSIVAEKK